jgi:hypothetical protein
MLRLIARAGCLLILPPRHRRRRKTGQPDNLLGLEERVLNMKKLRTDQIGLLTVEQGLRRFLEALKFHLGLQKLEHRATGY